MKRAVIVGVDKYEHYGNLKFAQSDANALRDKLVFRSESGFSTGAVSLLVDVADDSLKPHRTNILVALSKMCDTAREKDLILFYFAGHGFDHDNTSYLVAKDTHPNALSDTGLKVNRILEMMNGSRAEKKVLILDACRYCVDNDRSGVAETRGELDYRSFGDVLKRAVEERAAFPGWELIVACGPGQFAWECKDLAGGIWTSSLLRAVDELGPDVDITVKELFDKASARVREWADSAGKGEQTPYYRSDCPESAVLFQATRETTDLDRVMGQIGVIVLTRGNPVFKRTDNWDPSSGGTCIHLVPFKSEIPRRDLKEWSEEHCQANREFYLRMYLPPRRRFARPYDRLYLLFNGLGEADPFIFDSIGWDLASRKGIPSILIPLPVHFCRHLGFPCDDDPFTPKSRDDMRFETQRILQEIMCRPKRIIRGYHQIMCDARQLLRTIKDGFHPYWSQIFSGNLEVSLCGYSIGGFVALSLLLLTPENYRKAILLESGGFLDQIDAGILFRRPEQIQRLLGKVYLENNGEINPDFERLFSAREREKSERFAKFREARGASDPNDQGWKVFSRNEAESREIWQDIVTDLYSSIELDMYLAGEEKNVFKRVFLGHESLIHKKELRQLENKVLVIVGGSDDIFTAKLLLNQGPDTGLALLQIPGLTHWIKYRSRAKWHKWSKFVIDSMETFCCV